MVCLLETFSIMKSHVVIERWQEGDGSLNEYLGKLVYFDDFISIIWQCVTFNYCLAYQIDYISLEGWKKIWDKSKVAREEPNSTHEGVIIKREKR